MRPPASSQRSLTANRPMGWSSSRASASAPTSASCCWSSAAGLLLKCLRAHIDATCHAVVRACLVASSTPSAITPTFRSASRALLLLVCVPFFYKRPGFWPRAAVFTATTFACIAPLVLYFIRNTSGPYFRSHRAGFPSRTTRTPALRLGINILREIAMLDYHGDMTWRHGFFQAPAPRPRRRHPLLDRSLRQRPATLHSLVDAKAAILL